MLCVDFDVITGVRRGKDAASGKRFGYGVNYGHVSKIRTASEKPGLQLMLAANGSVVESTSPVRVSASHRTTSSRLAGAEGIVPSPIQVDVLAKGPKAAADRLNPGPFTFQVGRGSLRTPHSQKVLSGSFPSPTHARTMFSPLSSDVDPHLQAVLTKITRAVENDPRGAYKRCVPSIVTRRREVKLCLLCVPRRLKDLGDFSVPSFYRELQRLNCDVS
jgi:hypothetical protein